MLETLAGTAPAPGGVNCDYLITGGDWALILDGVSAYPVEDVGCRHGIPWFVARLGTHLATAMALSREAPLTTCLAEAISRTAADHEGACDLTNPLTPAATVAAVRIAPAEDLLHWLVLGDATVVWQKPGEGPQAITDDRADHLVDAPIVDADVRRYDPAFVASVRNRPGGFWVAAADSAAAEQAVTGTVYDVDLCRLGLFTDGLSRLVERYGWTWKRVFHETDAAGISGLIDAVRAADLDADHSRWRGKPSDDATAVVATVRRGGPVIESEC